MWLLGSVVRTIDYPNYRWSQLVRIIDFQLHLSTHYILLARKLCWPVLSLNATATHSIRPTASSIFWPVLIPICSLLLNLQCWISNQASPLATATFPAHQNRHLTMLTPPADMYKSLRSSFHNIHPSYIPSPSKPTSHYPNNTSWHV